MKKYEKEIEEYDKRFEEAKEEMLEAHKYIYKEIDLADFYYFVGNYCYKFIKSLYNIKEVVT